MLPDDQIRLITCLVLSVFISYFLSKIKTPNTFILTSFIFTVVFQIYVFREEVILLWVQQAIVYLLCKYANRAKIGRIVLFETFAYLIMVQVRRMYIAYGKNDVDITAVLMMQVFLYVGFAYNYEDGIKPKVQSPRKIYDLPSVTQYIGYVYFLPATLVGPVFEFMDYHNYIHRKQNYSTLPSSTWPGIFNQLKTFLLTLVIYFSLLSFNLDYMLTEEFASSNIGYKLLYMTVAIFAFRFKYYSAWSLGMLGMNATGITYNAIKDQKGQLVKDSWDRVEVSDIWTFEMDESMKKKADAWNKSVQLALKRYIYQRIYQVNDSDSERQKKSKQITAQQTTLFCSAIWHGLYPGYFVSFFHWALLLQISQELFRVQRTSKRFEEMRKQLKYLELIIVNFFLGYFGVCFVFMSIDKIWQFFGVWWYVPPVLVYIGNLLVVRMGLLGKKKRSQKTTENTKMQIQTPDKKQE